MKTYDDIPEIQQRIYLENELAYAFLTNIPITPGHTLIVPKRAIEKFEQLSSDELIAIHSLTIDVTHRLAEKTGAEGFNFAWNQGADYGQSIAHFHLHIVPRTPGDEGITEYEPRQFLYRPGSREATPEDELESFANQLRDQPLDSRG